MWKLLSRAFAVDFHKIKAKDRYDLGYQMGRKLERTIQALVAEAKGQPQFVGCLERVKLYELQLLLQRYPHLFQELRGLAYGAGVTMSEIAVLNFYENEIWSGGEHCSLILRRDNDQILIGWNEDGAAAYRGRMSLVEAKCGDLEFFTLNYPGNLCGDTLTITSRGLVFALQTLYPIPDREIVSGLPRGLAGRVLIEAKNLDEVKEGIRKLAESGLRHGFHLFVYDLHSLEALNIEVNPHKTFPGYVIVHPAFPTYFFTHTNHYLFSRVNDKQEISPSSRSRLGYLQMFEKASLSPEILANILSGRPPRGVFTNGGICRQGETVTLHSQVLQVPKKGYPVIWTSPGFPADCSFRDWEERKLSFV